MLTDELLGAIEDNTPFRNEEQEAWFALLADLEAGPPSSRALQVGYSQLIAQPDAYRARAVVVAGTVRRIERVEPAENDLGITDLYRVIFEPPGASWPITVYALKQPDDEAPFESSATGYFFKNLSYQYADGIGVTPVLLAHQLGATEASDSAQTVTTPDKLVEPPEVLQGDSLGRALLVQLGVDLDAYDQSADRRSLTREESGPFYQTLAAVEQTPASQLVRLAQQSLQGYAKRQQAMPQATQHEQLVAREVSRMAEEGRYSVAPLFGEGSSQRGELVLLDGIVRRALRIVVPASEEEAVTHPMDHYYELELFTEDSQNLPLVFCVRELPTGFPQGESIRQPARLAGFFFKQWAYRPRSASDPNSRSFAPLLIGRAPIPIEIAEPTRPGFSVGLVGVALLVAMILWIWRSSRADAAYEASTLARMRERGRNKGAQNEG